MSQTAFILISCYMGQEHEVLTQLKAISQIKTAIITYGEYDIIAKIQAESAKELANLISLQIRQIQKIRSTITLHVI